MKLRHLFSAIAAGLFALNADAQSAVAAQQSQQSKIGEDLLYCAHLNISLKKVSVGVGPEYEAFKVENLAEAEPIAKQLIAAERYDEAFESTRAKAWSELREKMTNDMRFGRILKPYLADRASYCKTVRTNAKSASNHE